MVRVKVIFGCDLVLVCAQFYQNILKQKGSINHPRIRKRNLAQTVKCKSFHNDLTFCLSFSLGARPLWGDMPHFVSSRAQIKLNHNS